MSHQHLSYQLQLLQELLPKMTQQQFTTPIEVLSGASVGGHARHIIEVANCLLDAPQVGVVDYIHRQRNLALEQQLMACLHAIDAALNRLLPQNSHLQLTSEGNHILNTNWQREAAYVAEHTVHHLALIKVALHVLECQHLVDDHFGVANSTIRYRASVLSTQ